MDIIENQRRVGTKIPSKRICNAAGLTVCIFLLAFAFYLQWVEQMEPCPLCILQRIAVIGATLCFLVALIHNPGLISSRVYAILLSVFLIAGAALALWHIRLQHLPADKIPGCLPSLGFMLNNLPLNDVIATVFRGSGSCAQVSWRFLGLTIPDWTLLWCVGMFLIFPWLNWRRIDA